MQIFVRYRWLRPALYVAAVAALYFSGWHAEVMGRAQQALLATGWWKVVPPAAARPAPTPQADYRLALRTLDGRATTLGELRGQVIVLNLWATWCPPCVAEMPGLQRLHESVKGERIVLALVSLDEKPGAAQRFAARRGFSMPLYTLNGVLPPVFATESIPTTFIIAPNGDIVSRHEGMGQFDTPQMLQFLRRLQRP
jgi:thiol-disulfide isomerase/thioredoxin